MKRSLFLKKIIKNKTTKKQITRNRFSIWTLVIVGLSLITGCVGPLLNMETGHTLGAGKQSFRVSSTTNGYYGLNYAYGLFKDFDLSFNLEAASLGLAAKYSFLNQESGFSYATQLGTGSTYGGSYYILAMIGSYGMKPWEFFYSFRYTKVTIDSQKLTDSNTGEVFVTLPKTDYSYGQAFLGAKYWVTPQFGIDAEMGSFLSTSEVKFDKNLYVSAGLEVTF